MESWHEGDGNSFFAVGDPMQSVYRFRDADVRLYQETFARGIGQVPLRGLHLTSTFVPARVWWIGATRLSERFSAPIPSTRWATNRPYPRPQPAAKCEPSCVSKTPPAGGRARRSFSEFSKSGANVPKTPSPCSCGREPHWRVCCRRCAAPAFRGRARTSNSWPIRRST